MEKITYHWLKIIKKERLTKQVFSLELEIPKNLRDKFIHDAGQYVRFRWKSKGQIVERDFSMTSTSGGGILSFGIKVHDENSTTYFLEKNYQIGDMIEISEPRGRFTLATKPSEFRTILGFAAGIGITPILSHLKTLMKQEKRTRFFLFYGNKNTESVAYKEQLSILEKKYFDRLQIHYFFSKEGQNPLYRGRIDEKKIDLIINQLLHLDDTDEESTLWDSVDEVLICGPGEMIKEIANACYKNGIRKENIHFELFETFDDDIYPIEMTLPLIKNIEINFQYKGRWNQAYIPHNRMKILQALLEQGYEVPFSCKSGICGTCIAQLSEGEVEQIENEYLTPKEEQEGKILPCMCFAKSAKINLDFAD